MADWKAWSRAEDLPTELRRVVEEGQFVPLLDGREAQQLRETVMVAFAECLDVYLEEQQLQWRMQHVHQTFPKMPMEQVFRAVGLAVGVSSARLKALWYTSRRHAGVQQVVRAKLKRGGRA